MSSNLLKIKRVSCRVRKRLLTSLPSLMLTNARSVKNKLDEISLKLSSFKPQLMIITESWLSDELDDSYLVMSNYQILRKDRCSNGGGILVYHSDAVQIEECRCLNFDSFDCKTEFLIFFLRPSDVLVIVIYHPHWGSSTAHSQAVDCVLHIMAHVQEVHVFRSLILCGDFNGLSEHIDDLNSLLGTSSLFNFATRLDAQLDFVLSDEAPSFKDVQRLSPLGNSDHCVILCTPASLPPPPSVLKRIVREKSATSCANFHFDLVRSDLSFILDKVDVNEAANDFVGLLTDLFDKHFPAKSIRVRGNDKPWVKPSLKLLINKRDVAYNKGKTAKYMRLRKAVNGHITSLKRRYLVSAVNEKNSSTMWHAIKNVISTRGSAPRLCPEVNNLKSVFSSAFSDTSIPLSVSPYLPSKPLIISIDEVLYRLRTLKNCSPGIDGIPPWILRDYRAILAPYIRHIFNLSVSLGVVPDAFKLSFVVPIPKGSQNSRQEYRPISMLPILSKILEKIVLKRWLLPLVPNIGSNQFAFVPREGQGTTVALTYTMNKILSFLDSPGAVRLLMIDFSKAFEKIPHNTILNALSGLEAPKELITWLGSYFSDRKQCVRANNIFSDWYPSKSGVPQGGVLSPLLFAISVNDFEPKYENSLMVKYADDICLLHFVRLDADDRLQDEINGMISWSSEHGLAINPQKTKLLSFQTKKTLTTPKVFIGSAEVEIVSSAKLLGVLLSSDFSWKAHVTASLRKARKRLFFLHRLRQARAPQCVLGSTYCSMIRSILSYAFPAWCNVGKTLIKDLIRFERRICKRFNIECEVDFLTFCETMARRLSEKSLDVSHPLNSIFDFSSTRFSSRLGKSHRRVLARTSRFKSSFIRFA